MKFSSVVFVLFVGVSGAGVISQLDCAKCSCTPARDTTDCEAKCKSFKAQYPLNHFPIWGTDRSKRDFYDFLVEIGPTCKIEATGAVPVEVPANGWCAFTDPTHKGWIIAQPAFGHSTPIIEGAKQGGQSDVIRIYQENTTSWFCPPASRWAAYLSSQLPSQRCPVPDFKTPIGNEMKPVFSKASAEITIPTQWKYDGSSNQLVVRAVKECYGVVRKIDYQPEVTGTFVGLQARPTTTSPYALSGAAPLLMLCPSLLLTLFLY